MEMEVVVLPVPPFWDATAMIMFVNLPKAIKGFFDRLDTSEYEISGGFVNESIRP